jgi:bifunctional UDP-N-acetylglucosamine pyrophosphorylase/glucosamine-1-phosphate N-acetyltransferase
VVVLAAGKGTRMRSRLPKVMHALGGRPMLEHVLRAAHAALAGEGGSPGSEGTDPGGADAEDHSSPPDEPPARYVVVVGHEREQVRAAMRWTPPDSEIIYVEQEPQRGTGDAVRYTEAALRRADPPPDTILVLYGDTPLVHSATLSALLERHAAASAVVTLLTGNAPDPTGYGRILRDAGGQMRGIVEAQDATAEELHITEINSGVCCFSAPWLWSRLPDVGPHPNGEYYLTDLLQMALDDGRIVATVEAPIEETKGINDRVQLAEAEAILRGRTLRALMLAGVTVEDPATTYVDAGVRVGRDTVLRPGTLLHGATVIGAGCEIGPHSVVRDSSIGDGCRVLASWVEEAVLEPGARVGPLSHLRPGARLLPGAHVGNFAEVKNATIGENVQMHHFSYIGDAALGADTNVGAGTITMNYDGRAKHRTTIGERVFLGSDTLLRAPVTVGDDAATGAGAVVTRDVPPGKLAVGMPARIRQRKIAPAPDAPHLDVSAPERPAAEAVETREHEE